MDRLAEVISGPVMKNYYRYEHQVFIRANRSAIRP